MDCPGDARSQGLTQQPDAEGGLELIVTFTVLQLRTVEIGPAVEDAGRQVRDIEQLDFDLVEPSGSIACLDINNAEFVVEKFALVVRIENLDLDNWGGKFAGEDGVEKVYQQPAIAVGSQQHLEYAVNFGINRMLHQSNPEYFSLSSLKIYGWATSLMPQRVDGIEPRGATSGKIAEDYPDRRREQKRQQIDARIE